MEAVIPEGAGSDLFHPLRQQQKNILLDRLRVCIGIRGNDLRSGRHGEYRLLLGGDGRNQNQQKQETQKQTKAQSAGFHTGFSSFPWMRAVA